MNNKFKSLTYKNLINGSNVPISELIDYIEEGRTMFDFLDTHPWLKIKNIIKVLDSIKQNYYSNMYSY